MKHVYFLPVCALLLVACSENESEADVQTGCYSASFTEASSSAPNDGAEDFSSMGLSILKCLCLSFMGVRQGREAPIRSISGVMMPIWTL